MEYRRTALGRQIIERRDAFYVYAYLNQTLEQNFHRTEIRKQVLWADERPNTMFAS